MEIRWLVSASTSCYYAVGAMLRGQTLADIALGEVLTEPADEFAALAVQGQVNPIQLIDNLTAEASHRTTIEDQARSALRKLIGTTEIAPILPALAAWMRQVESQFLAVHPNAIAELELRSVPLREQWESRGPGLMARLRRMLGPQAIAEAADLTLVQPALGGGGIAHVSTNRVSFEAVLANSAQDVPETIRLGWLLAQLQLDLSEMQGDLTRSQILKTGAFAMVPAALQAANEIELCGPLDATLPKAFKLWRLEGAVVDTLLAWWETYLIERPSWAVAIAGLHHLLSDDGRQTL